MPTCVFKIMQQLEKKKARYGISTEAIVTQ